MNKARGFTLIELLMTLVILTIAMGIAVPSMITFQRNAELTSASNTLTSAINAARGEAMKRNMYAYVTPLKDSDWNSGYRVFIDSDRSLDYDESKDLLLTSQDAEKGAIPANLEITGTSTAAESSPYLRFDGTGYLRTNAAGFTSVAMTIRRRDTRSTSNEFKETRNVMIARTGRVRTCKPLTATDANCNPADP